MLYISCLGIAKHIEYIGLCLAKFVKFLSIIFSNFLPHSFSSLRTLTPQISEFFVLCSRSLMILQLFSLYCSYLILIHIWYFCWNLMSSKLYIFSLNLICLQIHWLLCHFCSAFELIKWMFIFCLLYFSVLKFPVSSFLYLLFFS